MNMDQYDNMTKGFSSLVLNVYVILTITNRKTIGPPQWAHERRGRFSFDNAAESIFIVVVDMAEDPARPLCTFSCCCCWVDLREEDRTVEA